MELDVEDPAKNLVLLLDTYHDFHRGGQVGGRGRYNINGIIDGIIKKKFPDIHDRVNAILNRPGSVEKNTSELVGIVPTEQVECLVSIKPDVNLENLRKIFSGLGIDILDMEKTTKLICDAGPSHLKKLAADIRVPINLVHVVTPATACDSSPLQRGPAFGKPSIFEDGNSKDGKLKSTAAILSGSTFYEESNVFDANIPADARLYIDDKVINIKSAGPSVDALNPAIANKTKGAFDLDRFTNEQLLDIKRCGDSDQINHLISLRKRSDPSKENYVFVTGDKIAAIISAGLLNVPTIFQTFNKSTKYFTIYNPVPRGGNGDDVDMSGSPSGEDVDMSGPLKTINEDELEAGEYLEDVDFFQFLTGECAQRVRSIISSIIDPTGRRVGQELAARCSYHVIEKYKKGEEPISDKLLYEYIAVHNSLYEGVGWGIIDWPPQPSITAKLSNAIGFDYTILRGSPFLEILERAKIEVLTEAQPKMNPGSKTSFDFFKRLETITAPFGILTYGLIGDLIESYDDPSISVTTRLIYPNFLPAVVKVPRLSSWGTGRTVEIYNLLTQNIAIALEGGRLSQEAFNLSVGAGRRHKTFRRKNNGVSKRSKKHTYRATTNSYRKRRAANPGISGTGSTEYKRDKGRGSLSEKLVIIGQGRTD